MKKLFVVLLVISAGLFLSGCTKTTETDQEDNEIENVTVVENDDEQDDAPADPSGTDDVDNETDDDDTGDDDSPTDEIGEEDDDAENEEEDDDEDETETETATELEGGAQSVGEATSADGAAVTAYSYGTENGRLEFSWKVRATDAKPYPKVKATPMSDGTIVVEFESLSGDYVATEESETDLGSLLPDLEWEPTDNGSKYTFEFESEREFDLTGEEIDGDTYIVLRVTL